jgi:hypothetical protein
MEWSLPDAWSHGRAKNSRRFGTLQTEFAAPLETLNPRAHAHGMALREVDGNAGWRAYVLSQH